MATKVSPRSLPQLYIYIYTRRSGGGKPPPSLGTHGMTWSSMVFLECVFKCCSVEVRFLCGIPGPRSCSPDPRPLVPDRSPLAPDRGPDPRPVAPDTSPLAPDPRPLGPDPLRSPPPGQIVVQIPAHLPQIPAPLPQIPAPLAQILQISANWPQTANSSSFTVYLDPRIRKPTKALKRQPASRRYIDIYPSTCLWHVLRCVTMPVTMFNFIVIVIPSQGTHTP